MKAEAKTKRPHYAWFIMLACIILAGAGSGIFNSTIGVFVRPVCEELGFLRGSFNLYSTIFYISNMTLMPIYGMLYQKFSFRKIALTGSVMLSLALVGYSFSRSLWQFYLFALMSGIFFNCISTLSVGILINRWFIDRRGLASGIAYSGSGILAAVMLPLCNRLIEQHGWSWTYRFVALVVIGLTVPIILFVVRDKPESIGLEAYRKPGATTESKKVNDNTGVTRKQALRSVSLWSLFIAVVGIAICQAGPNTNTVSILTDIGYTASFSASVSSAYLLSQTVCKVGMGYVFDKLGPLKGGLLIGGSCIVYPIVALFNHVSFVPWIYVFLLAIANSGSTVLGAVLVSSYFGRRDYSNIYSIITLATQLGAALSNPLLGTIYDLTGGYNAFWFIVMGVGVIVCACMFVTDRKKLDF